MPAALATPTIGVFDSGFGGLTVLRALIDLHPHARFVYLGDTARLPYGSKSQTTVARYAVSSARFLLDQGADLLVIACNTASALALDEIRAAVAATPVVGVITPGAQAALTQAAPTTTVGVISTEAKPGVPGERTWLAGVKRSGETCVSSNTSSSTGSALATNPRAEGPAHNSLGRSPRSDSDHNPRAESPTHDTPGQRPGTVVETPAHNPTVLVLATAATVASGAYTRALAELGLAATEKACPLFVPLVEEGWTDHPVTAEVARIYLAEALAEAPHARTLLLGCTHYPLLAPLLQRTAADLGHPLTLIDSARATAQAVLTLLGPHPTPSPTSGTPAPTQPNLQIFATDSVDKFQRLGSHFLGRPLPPVHLVDLGG